MAGLADVFSRTGSDVSKHGYRSIDMGKKINIFGVCDDGISALPNSIRPEQSDADIYADTSASDTSWIECIPSTNMTVIGDGEGTSADTDANIAAREQIIDAIVEEINSSYPRVWEAVQARDPHI